MANKVKPVAEKEALQYEKDALLAGLEKRKQNIKVFEDAIAKEYEEIEREKEMIKIIELHQNVK
ncbi:hypothetical protein A2797_01770 [candidate division WWE3 bacterium RIFCSPHIGHO2_01_FULL_48_15]|uniref:Uncharacterized protein n=1 Tax=candidate division WWE3 bacterium RIFCSPHIGHO2_01_FULL_48_15 TaxID=1802619 RepID=A0A1F4VBP9_UNCKA|nr:MAG: hypothetical protein A2797_01770 [candidate division WWE3 bacterium RIFCSPHIGHO2_01_FULL_48_15]